MTTKNKRFDVPNRTYESMGHAIHYAKVNSSTILDEKHPDLLDMLFIDENWRVVGVINDVPPLNLESRGVDAPSLYVLELKAGEANRLGLFSGMQMTYTAPAD